MDGPGTYRGVTRALFDTTAIIDIHKMPSRRKYLEELRGKFDLTIATDIVQLEFKAVLIAQMITIHARLKQHGVFIMVRDELCESSHPQSRLRVHIFNHIMAVFPPKGDIDFATDSKLAEKGRRILKVQIPLIYEKFSDHIDAIDRKVACTRAIEPPRFNRGAFDPNLPICRRGRNKECKVEQFIRERMFPRLSRLRQIAAESESQQLAKACDLIERVTKDTSADISSNECRSAGDALIAIAAEGLATHVLSTNRREWEPLSKEIGAELVEIKYEKP
jgi:hypothetical protein